MSTLFLNFFRIFSSFLFFAVSPFVFLRRIAFFALPWYDILSFWGGKIVFPALKKFCAIHFCAAKTS